MQSRKNIYNCTPRYLLHTNYNTNNKFPSTQLREPFIKSARISDNFKAACLIYCFYNLLEL